MYKPKQAWFTWKDLYLEVIFVFTHFPFHWFMRHNSWNALQNSALMWLKFNRKLFFSSNYSFTLWHSASKQSYLKHYFPIVLKRPTSWSTNFPEGRPHVMRIPAANLYTNLQCIQKTNFLKCSPKEQLSDENLTVTILHSDIPTLILNTFIHIVYKRLDSNTLHSTIL